MCFDFEVLLTKGVLAVLAFEWKKVDLKTRCMRALLANKEQLCAAVLDRC